MRILERSACKNGESFESIIDDSVVKCDEIFDLTKNVPIDFKNKKATCEMDNFCILLVLSFNYYITIDNH